MGQIAETDRHDVGGDGGCLIHRFKVRLGCGPAAIATTIVFSRGKFLECKLHRIPEMAAGKTTHRSCLQAGSPSSHRTASRRCTGTAHGILTDRANVGIIITPMTNPALNILKPGGGERSTITGE